MVIQLKKMRHNPVPVQLGRKRLQQLRLLPPELQQVQGETVHLQQPLQNKTPLLVRSGKRISFFCLFFLFCTAWVYSQPELDNTLSYISGKPDSVKAKLLNDSSLKYRGIDCAVSYSFSKKANEFADKTHDSVQLARSYNYMGVAVYLQNKLDESVKYFDKAERTYLAIKNKKGAASSRLNMGIVYAGVKNYNDALKSYKEAYDLSVSEKDSLTIAACLTNIGSIYYEINKLDSSLAHHERALAIRKNLKNNHSALSSSYTCLGTIYNDRQQYEKAEYYHTLSLKEAVAANSLRDQVFALSNLGSTCYSLGKYKEGEKYLNRALDISTQLGTNELKPVIYSHLADCYRGMGDHNRAFETMVYSYKLKDSLNDIDHLKAIDDLQAKYETGKKQLQIESLNKDNELKQIQIERDKSIKTLFLLIALLSVLVGGLAIYSYISIKRSNKKLTVFNAEILQQKEEIEIKNNVITEKSLLLEIAYEEIRDSINYARRIQHSILPAAENIQQYLKNNFILFLPKDIVSGDFYFFHPLNEYEVVIAVCDCTGHGVPGAFMSMIGNEQLIKIISEQDITKPSEILNALNKGIRKALKQDTTDSKDGMDIVLCKINTKTKNVEYAGANRPLWIVRKNGADIEEVKSDKRAIGGYEIVGNNSFTNHVIQLEAGDSLYMFSDGYADQFGGEKGKKFMVKNLQKSILSLARFSMTEQQDKLLNTFKNWQGTNEQLDDVCLIGIRI